jgi:predicted NBD/HSP70 family sugar kinase
VGVTFSSGGSGDHPPRHVHVFDNDGKIITRVNLDTMQPMDIEKIDRKIVDLINELREEGRF